MILPTDKRIYDPGKKCRDDQIGRFLWFLGLIQGIVIKRRDARVGRLYSLVCHGH
jgi:hypothetical protein